MLNRLQAQVMLQNALPEGTPIKAWAEYQDLFLFRIEHQTPFEKDWDPFFSVDPVTEEIRDFSVLEDLSEIGKLEWHEL